MRVLIQLMKYYKVVFQCNTNNVEFKVALEAKWYFLSNFLFFHFSIDIYVH